MPSFKQIAQPRLVPPLLNLGRKPHLLTRGFTLIELLVVIAIVGVLIGLATPSMSKFVADWRVNSAINSFSRDFRLARTEAIKRSRPVVICKANANYDGCATGAGGDDWTKGWLVFVDNKVDGEFVSGDGDEIIVAQRQLPGIASFLTSSGTAKTFTLVPNGLMKGASNVGFTLQSSLRSGNQAMTEQKICIARSGRVRKGDSHITCDS